MDTSFRCIPALSLSCGNNPPLGGYLEGDQNDLPSEYVRKTSSDWSEYGSHQDSCASSISTNS